MWGVSSDGPWLNETFKMFNERLTYCTINKEVNDCIARRKRLGLLFRPRWWKPETRRSLKRRMLASLLPPPTVVNHLSLRILIQGGNFGDDSDRDDSGEDGDIESDADVDNDGEAPFGPDGQNRHLHSKGKLQSMTPSTCLQRNPGRYSSWRFTVSFSATAPLVPPAFDPDAEHLQAGHSVPFPGEMEGCHEGEGAKPQGTHSG